MENVSTVGAELRSARDEVRAENVKANLNRITLALLAIWFVIVFVHYALR